MWKLEQFTTNGGENRTEIVDIESGEPVNLAMNAQKCPVCDGDGKVSANGGARMRKCHGCDGRGWVLVPGVPPVQWWITVGDSTATVH